MCVGLPSSARMARRPAGGSAQAFSAWSAWQHAFAQSAMNAPWFSSSMPKKSTSLLVCPDELAAN
eukprot:4628119-Pyramimonas_sp.AAC.1